MELLLPKISIPISKNEAISLAAQSINQLDELLQLCRHSRHEVAFRAAWILEILHQSHPKCFNEASDEFIEIYLTLKNQSSKRHFTKILISMIQRKENVISNENLDYILEATFEWLIDTSTPVAVRVNCMEILYHLKDKNDWIADELHHQIEFRLLNGSAALRSRGKRILNDLSKTRIKLNK